MAGRVSRIETNLVRSARAGERVKHCETREHLLREVLASGASEGSSERALTVDEHRRPEAEKRSRLGRCVALVWVD